MEFLEVNKLSLLSKEELFEKYISLGGMPDLKYFELKEKPSFQYLIDVYNTVLVKDVVVYNNIRDVDIFNRILRFAVQNIGSTFSATSIKKYLKSENRNVTVDTILNYLEYCVRAFIIKKIPRFDLKGKKFSRLRKNII